MITPRAELRWFVYFLTFYLTMRKYYFYFSSPDYELVLRIERVLTLALAIISYFFLLVNSGFYLPRKHIFYALLLMLVTLLVFFVTWSPDYPAIFLFLPYIILLFLISSYDSYEEINRPIFHRIVGILTIASLSPAVFYLFEKGLYRNEFFFISPTSAAVTFLTSFFILILSFNILQKRRLQFWILFLVFFILIALTGVRVQLLYFTLSAYLVLNTKYLDARVNRIIFLFCAFMISAFYPFVYQELSRYINFGDFLDRYEYEDYSFLTRLGIQYEIIDTLNRSDFFYILFGHGAGASRDTIISAFGLDLRLHNDFLGLLFDHGFIVLIILLFFSIAIGSTSSTITLFMTSYYFAMLHNMFDSHYLASCIFIAYWLERSCAPSNIENLVGSNKS